MEAVPAATDEKVFVAVPAEPRAGQSTLSWALGHLYSSRATTIVVTHVHVPPQMIPIMGVKFHVSKMGADQVLLFRRAEREMAEEMLDDYVNQCSEIKVKCEKLVIENEDVASGLVELIRLHGITKLVIAGAADKQYSKKLNKPVSKTATEVMQRADPSCKIWFVCKEKLICIRDKEVQVAPAAVAAPTVGQEVPRLPFHQEEGKDDIKMEKGFDDELEEARKAVEDLMKRALKESCRRQKADEEMAASLQKAKVYEGLYLEEAKKREQLEAALARADREIAQLRRAFGRRNETTEGPQEATVVAYRLRRRRYDEIRFRSTGPASGHRLSLFRGEWWKRGGGAAPRRIRKGDPVVAIVGHTVTYDADAARRWLAQGELAPNFTKQRQCR